MTRTSTRIGRYDLISPLATGGMGRIYLARTSGLGGFVRKVAVKTLEIPTASDSDPSIAMFLDEARLMGLLHHQHIACVFEIGRADDGRHYMVLEYIEGYSAHEIWERALQLGVQLPLDFTLSLVSAAANGLHYAHTRNDEGGKPLGIVHRDVTPSNVMVGHDGAIKLIDFGIAMAASRAQKTQTGLVKGKVGYLSPEQVSGREVDARTDVFALGIFLYELTTMQRAFRDTSDLATMQRIKQGKVVRPSQLVSDYPRELEAIVMRALQVDPKDRYPNADEMRRAVEALGHRMRLVLGDAAVMEVMGQLFEPAGHPRQRPASADDDPALDWVQSDHDMTVRRDPKELLDQLRAAELQNKALPSLLPPEGKPRKLRAATEAADAAIEEEADASGSASMTAIALYAVDLPEYRAQAAAAGVGDAANGQRIVAERSSERPASRSIDIAIDTPPGLTAVSPAARSSGAMPATRSSTRMPAARASATMAAAAPPPELNVRFADKPVFGAGVVAHGKKPPLRWIAAGAGAVVLAGIVFAATRSSSKASAEGPPPAPAAARAAVAPPMPVTKPPPAPPAAPAKIHVKITSKPADATVLLDGKKLGHTPFDDTIDADPGKHNIKVRRKGYLVHSTDVTLAVDITQDLTLTPQR